MDSSKRNMSDYIASLNAPLSAAPEVTAADFDEANFLTTTDFLDFDFIEGSAVDAAQQDGSAKFQQSWTGSAQNELFSPDFQINAVNPNFVSPSTQTTATKRKHSEVSTTPAIDPSTLPLEEHSRLAAEEDKRRRNTAASARFRVKKKQREQALEKTAKDMTDKATRLEKRVHELEMENRWLKGLITDKDAGEGDKLTEMFARLKEEKGLEALAS